MLKAEGWDLRTEEVDGAIKHQAILRTVTSGTINMKSHTASSQGALIEKVLRARYDIAS